MLNCIHPTTRCRGLSASPILYKMKQVLIAKLKLVPTTKQLNLLWDILLASQNVLNYASRVALLLMSQLSRLSDKYVSLARKAVGFFDSFFFTPKLAAFLTQELGQAIYPTLRTGKIPRRGRDGFYLQPFQHSL